MPITLTFPVWILLGCLVCSLGACVGLIFGACFRVGKDKQSELPISCATCRHNKGGTIDAYRNGCINCFYEGKLSGYERH